VNTDLLRSAMMLGLAIGSVARVSDGAGFRMTRQQVIDRMKPFDGRHVRGVDTSTLRGKVMCGYQGWFAAEGDGSDRGWTHYCVRGGRFEPGACTIDLWPDMSEMDPDEKYQTSFRHADGRAASVFSPCNPKTVMRHFLWMKEHDIDGVFLQRFGASLRDAKVLNHRNVVTDNVRVAANATGRAWAIMYDLSGLKKGEIRKLVIEDWKNLVSRMAVGRDRSYLRHNRGLVVAVWGVGFDGGREYTLDECAELVKFLKEDKVYGGNTVMLGVPTGWRTLSRDALDDKRLHDIIRAADVVSPWTVGRYRDPAGARRHAEKTVRPDIEWCAKEGKDYMPVVFPGFSWHNLRRSQGLDKKLGEIPRRGGEFLWSQAVADVRAGARMVYVAMFDEVDEGTAIFKCTNDPPVGESRFLTYDGLPADHYMRLAGLVGRMLQGKLPVLDKMPERKR